MLWWYNYLIDISLYIFAGCWTSPVLHVNDLERNPTNDVVVTEQ